MDPDLSARFYDFYSYPKRSVQGGLTLDSFLNAMGDDALERTHDYIQWVFPNPFPSRQQRHVAQYPCTKEQYDLFKEDSSVMALVHLAVAKILAFWGIAYTPNRTDSLRIHAKAIFRAKLLRQNHNQLRFTRLIVFLRCVGLDTLANALVTDLIVGGGFASQIEGDARNHWFDALYSDIEYPALTKKSGPTRIYKAKTGAPIANV